MKNPAQQIPKTLTIKTEVTFASLGTTRLLMEISSARKQFMS